MSDKQYVYMVVYDDGYEYFLYEPEVYRNREAALAILRNIEYSDPNYRLERLELK
jgi:hypothetical protein